MENLGPKVASRFGAAFLSLSLLLVPVARASDQDAGDWPAKPDIGEDFSRFGELIHSQSNALTDAYVSDALLRSGQTKDARLLRQQANRQFAMLKAFARISKSAQLKKEQLHNQHKADRSADPAMPPDPPLDLAGCSAACAKGMIGIVNGDFNVANVMAASALDKMAKFGDAQIPMVLPALANIDELLQSRYFACDFPIQFVSGNEKESLLDHSMLSTSGAPATVRSFNWQSASALPRLTEGQNDLSASRRRDDRSEQAKVATDGRQLAWLYKVAHEHEKSERWLRRVLPYYLQHLADNPRALRDVFYELGEIRLFQSDKGDALQCYRQALAIDLMYPATAPDSFWLLDRMAGTCVGLGRLDDAEEYSKLALASLCADKKDLRKESIKDLLSGPAIDAALASKSSAQVRGSLQTLADQCWRSERYEQVRLILEYLLGKSAAVAGPLDIEQIPVSTGSESKKGDEEKNRMLLVQLGYLHFYDGDFQAGIDCFNRVLTAKQNTVRDRADYYGALGQLADDLGLGKQAQKDFDRSIHLYKIYCRKKDLLEFEDLDWVSGYVDSLAWQNYMKHHFGKGDDYLLAVDTHRWRKPQVKVFVSENADKGFDAPTAEKLYSIFETWTKITAGRLTCTRVPDYEAADITVERAGDNSIVASGSGGRTTFEYQFVMPVGGSNGPGSADPDDGERRVGDRDGHHADGLRGKGHQPRPFIAKAHINLLCRTPSATELSPIGAEKLFSLTLHEAGHALGLDGHSPNGKDIMYWKSAGTTLSQRDIASLSHLYAGRE
jgi:tetratricopeptide (TPR) repeat protein